MRERHRLNRWEEEVIQVKSDMELIENWFKYQSKKWEGIAEENTNANRLGHKAYAYKQVYTWDQLCSRIRKTREELRLVESAA